MEIRKDVALGPLTTFGIGGPARWFVEARTEHEVEQAVAWARERSLPLFVLGGGSNLLVRDAGFDGLVMKMGVAGVVGSGDGLLDVGAGEDWNSFVLFTVHQGLAGIECLAGIPGSVGGTPVQNVGAYGQEVSETVESVRALDLQTNGIVELSKADCRFRYRESLFNTDQPGRYIVLRVRFRLRPGGAPTLKYAELRDRFAGTAPTLAEVARAVRAIRHGKGMLLVDGETDCRSAGSFFKNPVVDAEHFARVQSTAGSVEVPHWPTADGRFKLPAAWLLEHAGFVKGYGDGPVGISSRHTLALVNRGGATFADVERMQAEIVRAVQAKFGVELVREPVVL